MEHRVEPLPSDPLFCTAEVRPAQLALQTERLRQAQQRLQRRSSESILATLDNVVQEWLRPGSPWMRRAQEILPAATGFSDAMIQHALPFQMAPIRAPHLRSLLDEEIGEKAFRIDRPNEIPNLIVHVLPGNLPGLAAIPVALSLSLRSAALVKAASGDRVFPTLWAQSISEVDAELGACVAVSYWTGGDHRCEEVAFAAADLVVASGDDRSVDDARRRCPTRFIGHGHRISFAVVTRESVADAPLADEAAEGLGLDVALWDQRGCLSPQVCFLEGTFEEAGRFAMRLADAFDRHARLLPPRKLSVEEQIAVRRFRDEAEWENISGRRCDLFRPNESLDWSITVEAEPIFRPTPLCRSLRILPLRDIAEIDDALQPARPFLQGAGLACPTSRQEVIVHLLTRAGVSRISPLGEMQKPPLNWRQGGRPRIADWVAAV
jgi:hypothetical protein